MMEKDDVYRIEIDIDKRIAEVEELCGPLIVSSSVRTVDGIQVMIQYRKNNENRVVFGYNLDTALRKVIYLEKELEEK